ncbi:glutamate--tRNA ligase [Winogradskyella sp. DF17]|jgi:glutamyl-tRNA synthetase|uniref:Glutamate--tRNA ligase n=1 Tax=Winogradskyella pelagia TaxID=2819984 RepID=A0ABS3SXM9_9FLAO|nr:glutamate--tRNA ligase [Winogradskyella sp. DF17]MBO3115252.1 glutamate--tRNA ligase [Winogradskyella sp. DF17]
MSKHVRVRFAPSPTGPLHIGGVRTALFNYLFAKKHGGDFVLRIEDTDQNRYIEGAEDYIIESLNWCGIPFDEGPAKNDKFGPYRQSERQELYKTYADKLIEDGKAYFAFDTPDQLDAHRKQHEAEGKTFIYNWHNREKGRLINSLVLSKEETDAKIAAGDHFVVRFKSPKDQTVSLTDIVRGEIKIDTNTLDDKILFKSDGMPTYHLANIVDDHLMEISHVIRGEEWLPSLALHKLLYDALDWKAPEFAHLPLILNPTGKGKLSKRHASKLGIPVFPLEWVNPETKEVSLGFREEGYFPEAVINFLAFLGWNPGTEQELYNIEQLIKDFDLDKVQKGGARFDPDKTKWFNHHYMQQQLDIELAHTFKSLRPELKDIDINYVALIIGLIKERATFVSEFWDLSHYFFIAPDNYEEKASKKAIKPDTIEYMQKAIELIAATREFTVENLQAKIKDWITEHNIGFGKVMMPLRLALVGALRGPDVFEIMFMIGKNETLKRIESFIGKLPS